MGSEKKIKGTITYQNISTGFWGVVDENDRKWRPIDLPEELQKDGLTVKMTIRPLEVGMSIFMWGEPVEILDYAIKSSS